jgi:uncharacterized protein YdiU (UPF0061 family)
LTVSIADSLSEKNSAGWRFENTFARLPEVLFTSVKPAKVREPRIAILNRPLAEQLGLDLSGMPAETAAAIFSGQELPSGSQPIAQAYAGHQFGGFTMLGDGRAILLGEHRTPSGQLVDIQFKGAGRTKFSRGGDGRAALGPMLREYVVSEAMFALGIPTTRSLAVVTTGEPVHRESVRKGAILTRVAESHIRVGTFEYLGAIPDEDSLRALADYAIERHYPDLVNAPRKYLEFFRAVVDRQASLIAQWQLVGFIHGVMNTDNMAISGETIDYGPCAFMNAYDPATVFSSIDRAGRYAYSNQPAIGGWNLARFAESLLPLLAPDQDQAIAQAMEVLTEYAKTFEQYWLAGMRKKLGLSTVEESDTTLVQALLDWMKSARADFTNTFRDLSEDAPLEGERYQEPAFQQWFADWQARLTREERSAELIRSAMQLVNPAVIPRNDRVEEALAAAEDDDDISVLEKLLAVLVSPYERSGASAIYQVPPANECGYRTFCGT